MTASAISSTSRNLLVGAFVIGPLLFYPAYYLVVLLIDTFIGDGLIVGAVTHFSKREILGFFISDWTASLAFAYAVCLAAFLLAVILRKRFGYWIEWTLPVIGAALAVSLSVILFGGSYLVTHIIAGIVFCAPAGWILSKCYGD